MSDRPPRRIRDWMEIPGRYRPGRLNAITDVPGVSVGHTTLHTGTSVRTGVTVILPHEGDPFADRCPAAVHVGNGFGKLTGALQIAELGELESAIALTNTLSVPDVMRGLLDHYVPSMPAAWHSINVVVGETNDGYLNDIKARVVRPEHVAEAIRASGTEVAEGCVGAGTGTCCFGYKGGIGTSSRVVPRRDLGTSGAVHVGALVQSNYGGTLTLYGRPASRPQTGPDPAGGGSCMIVVATDAPLDSRQVLRLARRGIVGLTRTGSDLPHDSGDFCLAFSNALQTRRPFDRPAVHQFPALPEPTLSALFAATIEAVTEALYNSLTMAVATTGFQGHRVEAFDPRG
jgi:D-aminopeptidase